MICQQKFYKNLAFLIILLYPCKQWNNGMEWVKLNSRQLQCAILLSEVRNFSQVAEQLNISQPALSKQILTLEKEMGVRLFDRNTSPLTVTAAGEYFIHQAREILLREDLLLHGMDRYRRGEQGRLVIGVSPFRGLHMLPSVIRQFKEKYPDVQVSLDEPPSDRIRKGAADGEYDFAIVNLPVDEEMLDVVPMEKEVLVLAVPDSLCHLLPAEHNGEIDLAECTRLPLITAKQPLEMRRYFDQICKESGTQLNIAVEVTGLTTAWAMARAGIGAAFLPLQFLRQEEFGNGITLFRIKGDYTTRQPVVVTRKNRYLPEYARYAIELLTKQKKDML